MNNKIIAIIVGVILVGGSSFYAGMKYGQSNPLNLKQGNFSAQGGQNLTPEQRQQRAREFGGTAGIGTRAGRAGAGFIGGEIISKDDKSITLKLQDGGSKIVFLSDSTEIAKSDEGVLSDLEIGKNITVNGAVNSDGSVTAQTIQIRPAK
ncbi:hypothetical protein KJ934_01770 [Patescibacteria group bacterium]|nr:hypothetical protein [Patescibacteria group bacterium]MBU4353344.1 hypothetical protein [Patescibacteria group bacterium]MBU4477265.1 hypothetical protein [Patescibacteria group bacterium]MCG2699224.1 hypothetical protein [Candidatus Parcubacteria bacterium]